MAANKVTKSQETDTVHQIMFNYLESVRPPEHIRPELDIAYTYDGHAVEIFEIRPRYYSPGEFINLPAARIRHFKSKGIWKLYWMRASGKWYPYEPGESSSLKVLLNRIENDEYGCFYS